MKKIIGLLLATVLTAAILVAGYYALIYKPCQEPSELLISLTQMDCVLNLSTDPLAFRAQICKSLGRSSDCVIDDKDEVAVESFINNIINSCAKDALKAKNYCTDQVKDIGK
jgi:hypothetical protein